MMSAAMLKWRRRDDLNDDGVEVDTKVDTSPTVAEVMQNTKMDTCKGSLCVLNVNKGGGPGQATTGTGWVVRNDSVAALITTRHMLRDCLGDAADGGGVVVSMGATAKFWGGETVELAGSRALLTPVVQEAGGTPEPLDVVVVVLRAGRRFPAPPVPCVLDIASADDIGSSGEFSLLHYPDKSHASVEEIRCRRTVGASSGSAPAPLGVVHYDSPTTGASSGGMLVDDQCRAFAVHVGVNMSGRSKTAVLLSAVHTRLAAQSPWCGIRTATPQLPEERTQATASAVVQFHSLTAGKQYETALSLRDQGMYNEALDVLQAVRHRKVKALGEEHEGVARTQYEIAVVLERQGKFSQALSLLRVVERTLLCCLGWEDVHVTMTQLEMAVVLGRLGKFSEALLLLEEVERKQVAALGEGHADVATTRYEKAMMLRDQGKHKDALALLKKVVRNKAAALEEGHVDVARTQHEMAVVLGLQGKISEALALLEVVVRKKAAALGEEHVDVATSQYEMAVVFGHQAKYQEALALLNVVLRKQVATLGEEHVDVATTQYQMAMVLQDQGKYQEALMLLETVFRKKVAVLGEGHVDVATTLYQTALVLGRLGKHDQALALLLEALPALVAALGEHHPGVTATRQEMGRALQRQGNHAGHHSEAAPSTSSAEEGDVDVLDLLFGAEWSKWKSLRRESESRSTGVCDEELRSFCCRTFECGWLLMNTGDPPVPLSSDLASFGRAELGDPSETVLAVLGAEVHQAFLASVAAYAGSDVDPAWLQSLFAGAGGCSLVDCVDGGDGMSSTILRSRGTLYVASAGQLSDTWSSWVDFFAAPTVAVDAHSLSPGAVNVEPAALNRLSVHSGAWASARSQRLVFNAVCDHVTASRDGSAPVTDLVFCGHGRGAAVSQLLAFHFAIQRRSDDDEGSVASSLVTFGCPAVGNAAFQELFSRLMWHVRLYGEHDPVAGLPRSLCVGLRFSPASEEYAETHAQEHWALSLGGRATAGSGSSPRVSSLSVAGLAFVTHHSILAYAAYLASHYEALSASHG